MIKVHELTKRFRSGGTEVIAADQLSFTVEPGQVFGLLMIIYPTGRYLLENIRSDELGQWGTEWTTAQWTSAGVIMGGIVLIGWGWSHLKRTEAFIPPKNQY